jgi:hypothetical protein
MNTKCDVTSKAAACRAQLALARGGHCRHGVQPIHCTDCTDTEESK